MEVKPGYKRTEVGVIPEEWDVNPLERVFALKHGFAFSSEHFSKSGPIVLTPGNFRLQGGLYFEERNTKRYSGSYTSDMAFKRGDLLIVMTDLTPDCNLLGKPAFVEIDEAVLHNQRIGKVLLKDKTAHLPFLYYALLSRAYLSHVKKNAFGSTVRHTSSKSIYTTELAWPPPLEQRAIATALSDVDALIGALTQLIAQKRNLKQAAMQQLLTGKQRLPGFHGEWEVKTLGDLFTFSGGYTASRDQLSTEGHCYLHYGDIHTSSKTFIDASSDYQDIPKLDIPLKRVASKSLLDDADVVFVDASEDDAGASSMWSL